MLDALKSRLAALATLPERVLPVAAIEIATTLRAAVRRSKRSAQKRRKAARAEAKLRFGAAAARKLVRMPKRRTSGISIEAKATPDSIIVTASDQVQAKARKNAETVEWMQILGDAVRTEAQRGVA